MPIKARFGVLQDKEEFVGVSFFNLNLKFNFNFNLINFNFN